MTHPGVSEIDAGDGGVQDPDAFGIRRAAVGRESPA